MISNIDHNLCIPFLFIHADIFLSDWLVFFASSWYRLDIFFGWTHKAFNHFSCFMCQFSGSLGSSLQNEDSDEFVTISPWLLLMSERTGQPINYYAHPNTLQTPARVAFFIIHKRKHTLNVSSVFCLASPRNPSLLSVASTESPVLSSPLVRLLPGPSASSCLDILHKLITCVLISLDVNYTNWQTDKSLEATRNCLICSYCYWLIVNQILIVFNGLASHARASQISRFFFFLEPSCG